MSAENLKRPHARGPHAEAPSPAIAEEIEGIRRINREIESTVDGFLSLLFQEKPDPRSDKWTLGRLENAKRKAVSALNHLTRDRFWIDNFQFSLENALKTINIAYEQQRSLLRYYIDKPKHSYPKTVADRFRRLEEHAKLHGGEGVYNLAMELFPELSGATAAVEAAEIVEHQPALPEEPPEKWEERANARESAPDFIKRNYEPWLGRGLTRSHIRGIDPKLHKALENWLSRPGNVMPEDLNLPSRQEANDDLRRKLARGEPIGIHTAQEAARIAAMINRSATPIKE